MLATPRCTDCSTHGFLPHTSSPLSPRSANIYGRFPAYMTSGDEGARQHTSLHGSENGSENGKTLRQKQDYSKRPVKKALTPKSDELKERRRSMFLKKVREGREDRRWEGRGEDIMRLDFMRQQRAWAAEQAREAPLLPSEPIDEEEEEEAEALYDLPTSSSNAMQISAPASQQPMSMPEAELDEVLQREQEEMDALLSYMGPDRQEADGLGGEGREEHLYSDDDYDALFSEVMDEGVVGGEAVGPTNAHDRDEEMDLS